MAYSKVKPFKWSKKRDAAVLALAEGRRIVDVADEVGVASRTIDYWLANPEFRAERDRLSVIAGIANRASRLRVAMRVIRSQDAEADEPKTRADLLDWLKYVQSETDGVRLDLTATLAAFDAAIEPSPVADPGSLGIASDDGGYNEEEE